MRKASEKAILVEHGASMSVGNVIRVKCEPALDLVERQPPCTLASHLARDMESRKSTKGRSDTGRDQLSIGAVMDADLDALCTVVYCTADDLLPAAKRNARRRLT